MSALFPIHTGEAGRIVGHLLSIVIGLWLITMIVAGVLLWAKRRKPRSRPVSASRQQRSIKTASGEE